jgi:hypothetical protein
MESINLIKIDFLQFYRFFKKILAHPKFIDKNRGGRFGRGAFLRF